MERATIVLTRYKETNELIMPCLAGLSRQVKIRADVLFLDQQKDKEIKKYCIQNNTKNIKLIYKNIPVKNLSYARNLGIGMARNKKVLFIDCDAFPDKIWAYSLANALNGVTAVVGGKAVPKWMDRNKWFCNSHVAREIYSLIDMGNGKIEKEKVIGVNFGINMVLLKKEAFFNESLGRRPGTLLGGEETDLCKRALQKGYKVYYVGSAVVTHQIQKERMNLFWLIKRFYYGGISRGIKGGMPKTHTTKRNLYDFLVLAIMFIPYTLGLLQGKMRYEK
jgi:GT2 family glycosyltransferase